MRGPDSEDMLRKTVSDLSTLPRCAVTGRVFPLVIYDRFSGLSAQYNLW